MSRTITLRRPANRRKKPREGRSPMLRAGAGLLVALLASGVFAGGGYALWRAVSESPHFNVKQVIVLHNERAAAGDIAGLLALGPDQNLFKLELGRLKEDVEKHPWVASARVYRRLPSTLVVDVTEHVPVAILQSGGLYYVSSAGKVFKTLRDSDNTDFPVLTGIDIVQIRRKDAASLEAVSDAVALLALIGRGGRPDLDSLEEIRWEAGRGMSLYSSEAVPVVHLGAEPWDIKWKQLQAIFLDLEDRGLDVGSIDFRSQRMAVLKLRTLPAAEPAVPRGGAELRPDGTREIPVQLPAADGTPGPAGQKKSLEI